MTIVPIHTETLKTLYERGFITSEALTAIAPIKWLAANYPELLVDAGKVAEAIAPKPKTCRNCIHFSSTHEFCNTRVDEDNTYLPAYEDTPACIDFEGVELPPFLKRR